MSVVANTSQESAETLIDQAILGLKAVYANALSAYPGMISDEIQCGEEFLPVYGEHRGVPYAQTYLSERLGYGACTADTAIYRVIIAWKYCAHAREYRQFELLYPAKNFDEGGGLDFVERSICTPLT